MYGEQYCFGEHEPIAAQPNQNQIVSKTASPMNTTIVPQQDQPGSPQPDLHAQPQYNGPSRLHRLPPHSVEAEQAVLGCLLLDPTEGINLFLGRIGPRPDAFYDIRHRTIFETILDMSHKGEPIDVVTLSNRLNNMNCLQSIGGQQYIAQLPDTAPAPASLYYYLEILRDFYLRRRLLHVCTAATEWVFDHSIDVTELLDRTEQQVFQVNSERLDTPQGIEKLAAKAVARAEFLFEHGGDPTGILTGFADFDRLTGGLHGGEMIVIAARPSVGKTALAMNIAEHVALNSSLPTAVFSLEMSAESLVMRLLCARASANLGLLRDRIMTKADLKRMRDAAEAVAKAPLYIDDTPGLSALELKARARRLRQRHRIALIIVDYLQLCHPDQPRKENRQQEIAEVSHALKDLARELNVPVIVLSQLNREVEKSEKPRKPQLSDLRESGAIEQDADIVGLLYKWNDPDRISAPVKNKPDLEIVHLLIAKHRNGPTGDILLTFHKGFTRFQGYAPIAAADHAATEEPATEC